MISQFNCVVVGGVEPSYLYKLTSLSIPKDCTSIKYNNKKYDLAYLTSKFSKYDEFENGKNKHTKLFKSHNLKELVLPSDLNITKVFRQSIGFYNPQAIFTEDKRIYLPDQPIKLDSNQRDLEYIIKKVNTIFNIDRYKKHYQDFIEGKGIFAYNIKLYKD